MIEPLATPTHHGGSLAQRIAVVVCAYTEERWDDIVAAIESARSQSNVEVECVLVIDHNPPLFERSQKHFGSDVRVVANNHKRGLSGARNTGIDSSNSPIIAFLDDDARGMDEWLETLAAAFVNPFVCGAGGSVESNWDVPRPQWWPTEFDWVVGCSFTGQPVKKSEIRNPIGANMAVRRSALEEAGSFSTSVGRVGKHPVGCEETELFIRIRQRVQGAHVVLVPDARVSHRVTAVRATKKYFFHRCYAEGISKAVVSQLAGAGDGLASERTYTTITLPMGVVRNIGKAIRGDGAALGRAAMIVTGFCTTLAGYLRGRIAKGPGRNLAEVPDPPGRNQ